MWSFLDQIDWLSAPTEADKRRIWQRSHPGQSLYIYTNCRDIKALRASALGQFTYLSFAFWMRMRLSLFQLEHIADYLRWQIGWQWRCLYNSFVTKYVQSDIGLK
jgi:hypothetical protein